MEALQSLAGGFGVALNPVNLMWSFVGVLCGTLIGILPGIGPALTIALLLPVTYKLDPVASFVIFGGIYYGAMFGSSTTAILVNTPGETGSLVTTIDGHRMARKGRAPAALATAAIGSFVAGVIGTAMLALVAPEVVKLALLFGPADYFALMCVAFVAVSSLLGSSLLRGLLALFIGLALGLVGIDQQTGAARFAFGQLDLLDGIGITVVVVGLFAVGEALYQATLPRAGGSTVTPLDGPARMTAAEWSRSWKPWLRGTAIGFPLGAVPAGGTELPTFISYQTEKRLSPRPEEFGDGAIEGVAGPEAANNAAVAGVLVPLLTLGIPTSATAAIMLAAFQQYGLQPGPLLFGTRPDLVWGLIASLFIGNAMLLVLNLPLAGLWARLLYIPAPWLHGGILLFAALGVYGVNRSLFDVGVMTACGVLGLIMRRLDVPLAPVIVGMILGPMAEVQFRRAVQIAQGDLWVFVTRPISLSLLLIALALLIGPVLWRRARANAGSKA
ncbi:MAG: tripartite tricarboxylate transporter permease [Alphaproteobacteria bacterium]|nr:tripartite tricarboxylate transporter permease [Alphaproteobacteria bacterium]